MTEHAPMLKLDEIVTILRDGDEEARAIGEDIDNETLGGATTHSEISGVTDYKCKDDADCLKKIRAIVDKLGKPKDAGFSREKPAAPKAEPKDLYGILPSERAKPYDMREVIARLVDGSEYTEYKEGYGQSILTCYARIDGWAVGIVANQRKVVKSKKGEMQFGGVIYSDSADKATRFIANCNQKNIPLVFLQDVTGFMVGSRSEHGGIIKDGAKLVNAVSNSVVPKFTVIVGNSYGAGNYAMCGRAFDPFLTLAWPGSKCSVMGAAQAANVLLQIDLAARERKGEKIDEEMRKQLLAAITASYSEQQDILYGAARGWLDRIIDPERTREELIAALRMAAMVPCEADYRTGVLQT